MQRCNKVAKAYSWFNGFRLCPAHLHEYTAQVPATANVMITSLEYVGPCDKPISVRSNARISDTLLHAKR